MNLYLDSHQTYIDLYLWDSLKRGRPGGAIVPPVPGRPTIWMVVGQWPIALAVGAGGGCLDILLSTIISSLSLSLSLSGRRPDTD